MTFSVYLMNTAGLQSSIKIGGYDTGALSEGSKLTLLKTMSIYSWELKINRATLMGEVDQDAVFDMKHIDGRTAVIDYALPFIYLPRKDWEEAEDKLKKWFKKFEKHAPIKCENNKASNKGKMNGRPSLEPITTESCYFTLTCDEVIEQNADWG